MRWNWVSRAVAVLAACTVHTAPSVAGDEPALVPVIDLSAPVAAGRPEPDVLARVTALGGRAFVVDPRFSRAIASETNFRATLPWFDRVVAIEFATADRFDSGASWRGRVVGDLRGDAVLTTVQPLIRDSAVLPSDERRFDLIVWSPDVGTLQVTSLRGEFVLLRNQFHPTALRCGVRRAGGRELAAASERRAACGDTVDVSVAYTEQAKKTVLDETGVVLAAHSAVACANAALEWSGVTSFKFHLLDVFAVEFTEPAEGIGALLEGAIRGQGEYRVLHDRRGNADLLSVFVEDQRMAAGWAQFIADPRSSRGDDALSVVNVSAAAPMLTLAHELGHNLGCDHDVARCKCCGSSGCDRHGFRFQLGPNDERITVMAEGATLDAGSSFTNRVPRYSAPLPYLGGPLHGESCCANNARVLQAVGCFAAGFRGRGNR